jgi:aryl-alcohol dehydrogenase-like predicted oxidoreductase
VSNVATATAVAIGSGALRMELVAGAHPAVATARSMGHDSLIRTLFMQKRRIGSLDVSVVGIGCNNFGGRLDENATAKVVKAALDEGINFFDTADTYGSTKSEEFLGRAFTGKRKDIIIATKFGSKIDDERKGAKPDYVKRAAEDSLKRLRTDYIDLYQLHRPDDTVPIADTLGALDDLVKAGKVREIGCSNFSADQLHEADTFAKPGAARFASVQNEYSLFHREPENAVLRECAALGISFIPYFPLANGLLTGKYRKGKAPPEGARITSGWHGELLTDENLEKVEKLVAFAESHGHTILELAFSWLLERSFVASVIAGATSPEQVHANANASGWDLTETELVELSRITL